MAILWFDPPVIVHSATNIARTRHVNNVQAAAEQLLTWDKRGAKWEKAMQACIDALEGKRPPDEVRRAFEQAARAAKMLQDV